MARLELASSSHLESILGETHALWGTGLTFEAYRTLWHEVASCPWARERVRYYVWLGDDGSVLSSAKLYRPRFRLGGQHGTCRVLGAIYTPKARRRRGHATALLRRLVDEDAVGSDLATLLFSDIGTAYYERFGFQSLIAHEHWGRLPPPRRSPSDLELHPATRDDLGWMRQAHEATSRNRPFAIVRDDGHWEFLWIRSAGFFSRLQDREVVQRWSVAVRGEQVVGYLVAVEGHGEWNLREVAALDGDPETVGVIVRTCAQRAYETGMRRFYGWFPPELPRVLRGWRVRSRMRRRALPMIRTDSVDFDLTLSGSAAGFLPFQDQF